VTANVVQFVHRGAKFPSPAENGTQLYRLFKDITVRNWADDKVLDYTGTETWSQVLANSAESRRKFIDGTTKPLEKRREEATTLEDYMIRETNEMMRESESMLLLWTNTTTVSGVDSRGESLG
jgi:hypothetical protein